MNKEFIPYEQALELRELGFDEPCLNGYDENKELMFLLPNWKNSHGWHKVNGSCIAPLYQQAFRWFREKYNMHFFAQYFTDGKWRGTHSKEDFNTYEEAEFACLKNLIEIAKNK